MTTHDEIRDTIEKLLSRNTAKSSFLARQLMFSVLPPSYFVENYLYDNEGRLQKLEDFPMLKHIYDNMPQKLLLKCSRKTLKSTLLSNFICLNLIRWNYFKMMYVGPQEMTTKYFSSNYLPPRFESPKIKNLLLKGWFKNDVFEKILDDTHSSVLFRYVSDDATRTRGPAVDCLVYDECVSKNTFILTKLSTGEVVQRRILDIHIGDIIVAYDNDRNIKYDKIKSIKSQGDRHCWRVTLSDGSFLECTAGSRILANRGWCYLTQLLSKQEIARCPKAVSIESAYLSTLISAKAIISSESGHQAEAIYLAQGKNIRELYKHPARRLSESGVRLSECGFHYGDYSDIRFYTYSTPHERVETEASIVSIEYIGVLPVYDLETEVYHTFFANGIAVHNCQDIQHDQIPIIQETMAMSPYKREIFAGTPLDSTNTIHRLWKTSNQLEWMMKCGSCNHWNSLTEGNDPLKMIKPYGFSCSKCGKVLNSRNGEWVSTNPGSYLMTGYHLAQPILPHFNEDPKEWREIYEKVHSGKNEIRVVMNETFGLSYDVGSKPITQEELVRLCVLGPQASVDGAGILPILERNRVQYKLYTMGVDWGVSMAQSRTVATLGAMRSDGVYEVISAKIYRGYDHEAHIADIANKANAVGAFCVSDSGPDPIRGIKLCELTSPQRSQLAAYRRTKMIQHFEPGSYDWRQNRWVLHRSDVISLVIRQLKAGKILFPQWGDVSEYMQDILNVFIEVRDGLYGQELIYDHHPKQPDDAMHSLVFAVCAAYMAIGDAGLLGPSSTSGTEPIMLN